MHCLSQKTAFGAVFWQCMCLDQIDSGLALFEARVKLCKTFQPAVLLNVSPFANMNKPLFFKAWAF